VNAPAQASRRIDIPEPGFFKLRLVRRGPFVGAEIARSLGFWSATINGASCGARHPDPAYAAGIERIWTGGTRIDANEYAALLRNPPATPDLPIDVSAMTPITFEETPMNAIAPIGHNHPPVIDLAAALEPRALKAWIDSRLEPHTARAALLTAGYGRFLTATAGGIANDNADERAVDFAEQIRQAIAATDATRVAIKAPVLAAQKAIDGAAKIISDGLLPAFTEVKARHTAFLVAKDAEIRRLAAEEAERMHAESQRARQEAERMEAAVQRLLDDAAETGSDEAMEQAVVAAAEQQAAEAEHDAAAEKREAATRIELAATSALTAMRTANGTLSGLKDDWLYEVVNLAEVPLAMMQICDAVVKAMIKSGTRNIPGLKIYNRPRAR
jgi:hypothetical protein